MHVLAKPIRCGSEVLLIRASPALTAIDSAERTPLPRGHYAFTASTLACFAPQDDSENDVRMFGIALQAAHEMQESGEVTAPSPVAHANHSVPYSDGVTMLSADWRRTSSEEVKAAKQFNAEEVILPASDSIAAPMLSPERSRATQSANIPDANIHGTTAADAAACEIHPRPMGCPRSQAGTVRDTQTDPELCKSAASVDADPRATLQASNVAAVGHRDPSSSRPQAPPNATDSVTSVHTIAETQGGSTQAPNSMAEGPGDVLLLPDDPLAVLDALPPTQIQDDCSSFPETELQEPMLLEWTTCMATQVIEADGLARSHTPLSPAHSTDTQPAGAPYNGSENASPCSTEIEGSSTEIGPCVHEYAASVDPMLQSCGELPAGGGLQLPDSAKRAKADLTLRNKRGSLPPLPFDESGNVKYVLSMNVATEKEPVSARKQIDDEKCGSKQAERSSRNTVREKRDGQPENGTFEQVRAVRTDLLVPCSKEKEDHQGMSCQDAHRFEAQQPLQRHNDHVPTNFNGNLARLESKAPDQLLAIGMAGTTQATVCESSDAEPHCVPLEDAIRNSPCLQRRITQVRDRCQSPSCGTVPETHTVDANRKDVPSQQVLAHGLPCHDCI